MAEPKGQRELRNRAWLRPQAGVTDLKPSYGFNVGRGTGRQRHARLLAEGRFRPGEHVRIVSEDKTAVVAIDQGQHVIVEMDGGHEPRRIPLWDLEQFDGPR